jgi:diguanylate cyclase (GGDEF)-like protein
VCPAAASRPSSDHDARVLIVDDSLDFCDLTTRLLAREGVRRVICAHRVDEALAVLERGLEAVPEEPFDLAILDVELPDGDGLELCGRLKEDRRWRDLQILIVTSHTEAKRLAAAFTAGAMDYLSKPIDGTVFLARVRSALRLKREIDERRDRERQLLELTRQLEEANRRLLELAEIDDLTELANRRKFNLGLTREWRRCWREKRSLALVLADIDHFKAYNDFFGHQRGDVCLQRVAVPVGEAARRAGDLACRWGGEEFALVLPGVATPRALQMADRLRLQVEALAIDHPRGGPSGVVTVSLGVAAVVPSDGLHPQDLLAAADQALYSAKQQGRNRVERGSVGGGDRASAG